MKDLDSTIDELYRLPLAEFTAKRNSAAKELSGSSRAEIKSLVKPSVALWAINQLYWRDKSVYNALIDASEKLRTAHRSLLSGKKTDVHKPEQVHRAALERAISKATAIIKSADEKVSDATIDLLRKALAALPTDERAGRLTRQPEAAGFSLLTGIKPRAIKTPTPKAPPPPPPPPKPDPKVKAAEKELERARQIAERARLKLAEAEQKISRLRGS